MDKNITANTISYKIGEKEFIFNKPYVMGILNVTPDSFSDGGKYFDRDRATNYALEMIHEGVDIIDIGGESTRPGSDFVSFEEEIERVVPVIKNILEKNPEAVISVDTNKSKVAYSALNAGAKIINDISGGTFDTEILNIAAEFNAAFVMMHIKGTPKNMQKNPTYDNLIKEIKDFLYVQTEKAKHAGIKNIFIDPGIGFGKTVENNYEIIKKIKEFKNLGYPVLIGLSRKSFIGNSLNLKIDERDNATAILETMSVNNGADIIRTHNYKNALLLKKIYCMAENV
jgi:dihydropteroate synthase